ncbi:MAG TPA: TetR family transcriptional regulator [Propionibacterium sp.]|nr:TetR family transcriptional regulator [Propionibacterium sp.]
MALTRSAIVATAMAILDAFGLADLSMRRIAGALGAAPAALYWHFANKQSLLAGVAAELIADLDGPATITPDALSEWCHELRDRLLAHRDGAELVSSVLAMRLLEPTPADLLAGSLIRAGFPTAEAGPAARLVVHFILGHTLDRQGYAQSLQLGVAGPAGPDPDEDFTYGVRLLVAGLSANGTG